MLKERKAPGVFASITIVPGKGYKKDLEPMSATLPSKQKITIVEMGGFHSTMLPVKKGEEIKGGAAYVAGAITKIRQQVDPILVSNGDVFTGQTSSLEGGGHFVIQFMNHLRFDAMTLGIHDFDDGQAILAERLKGAKFSILAANLACSKTGLHIAQTDHPLSIVKPFTCIERGMKTIAIVGMMKEETPMFQRPDNLTGLKFYPPKDSFFRFLPKILETNPHLIVVQYNNLSDANLWAKSFNEEVKKSGLKKAPQIMFIGGHLEEKPIVKPNYLIMQGTDRGYKLGIVQIKQAFWGNMLCPYYTEISPKTSFPDPKINQIVQEISKEIEKQNVLLGCSISALKRDKLVDCTLGILITEAMRKNTGADTAFVSSGTIKLDIPAGDIYSSNIDQAIPFKDAIVLMNLRGSVILSILEQSAKLEADSGGSGGKILQVAGIRFKYSLTREKGKRVLSSEIGGQAIDLTKNYTAAVSAYLVDGGDGYTQFADGSIISVYNELKNYVKDYIKVLGTFEIKTDSRIECISE